MIKISKENDCCGCAACSIVCPQKCIHMENRTLGAVFPYVNTEKCISCGKCDKVCPMNNPVTEMEMKKQVFAAFSKNKNIRFRGSSGGMFETFAQKLLQKGYVVYGSAFDKHLKLKCTSAETVEELIPLTKSKYLQSDLSEKYCEIEMLLKAGRGVLFVSTPCQIVALKNYLHRDYESLITVDFFCHGVPSQRFFDECLSYDSKKSNYKIVNFTFRVKKDKNGSTPHYYSVEYIKNGNKGIKTYLYFKSSFYAAFQKYISLRESCYNCHFSGYNRSSDITIGDFHDIDRYISGINRFDGVSTVIINTSKGKRLFDACKEKLSIYPLDLQQLIDDHVCFAGGTDRPKNKDDFILCYETKSFDELANRFMNLSKYRKHRIYYSLPKIIREKLKKYTGV